MSSVRDNPSLHRFELEVGGVTAFIDYTRKGDVVTFVHTEVPEALGGKGVGSELVRGALALVRSRGDKLIAHCPFTAAYVKKHPEYQDLLAEPLR
jgi:predicted GNAT family acetyltransferase